jgi:hypothetical protein
MHPVAQALLKRDALANIARLRVDAGLHSYAGQCGIQAIQTAARVLFIAMGAALAQGYSGQEPDLRIIRGAASAAGDIAAQPGSLPHHRQALISGLAACDRLWPSLHPNHLIHSYALLEQKLSSPAGLCLSDFESNHATRP